MWPSLKSRLRAWLGWDALESKVIEVEQCILLQHERIEQLQRDIKSLRGFREERSGRPRQITDWEVAQAMFAADERNFIVPKDIKEID